jgi:hypothetical protein
MRRTTIILALCLIGLFTQAQTHSCFSINPKLGFMGLDTFSNALTSLELTYQKKYTEFSVEYVLKHPRFLGIQDLAPDYFHIIQGKIGTFWDIPIKRNAPNRWRLAAATGIGFSFGKKVEVIIIPSLGVYEERITYYNALNIPIEIGAYYTKPRFAFGPEFNYNINSQFNSFTLQLGFKFALLNSYFP